MSDWFSGIDFWHWFSCFISCLCFLFICKIVFIVCNNRSSQSSRVMYWWNLVFGLRRSRPEVLRKKVFLKILQDTYENTYVRVSFLIKFHAWGSRRYWSLIHECFETKVTKLTFPRLPFHFHVLFHFLNIKYCTPTIKLARNHETWFSWLLVPLSISRSILLDNTLYYY